MPEFYDLISKKPEEDESEVRINKQIQKDSLKMINTTSSPTTNYTKTAISKEIKTCGQFLYK